MVLLTQFKSRPTAHVGQEVIVLEEYLTRTGDHFADAPKCSKAKALRQCQAVLHLRRGHIAVKVLAGRISSQLVFRSINAISVKGRLAAGGAGKKIVSKNLILAQTLVFVEGESVRLKREFAAQGLHEEVGGEFQLFSSDRVELIGTCIADQPQAQGPHGSVDPEARRKRRNFAIVWGQRHK